MYRNYNVHYYGVDSFDCVSPEFNEIIKYEDFTSSDNFIDVTINAIQNSGYVMAYINEYVLETNQKTHTYHEIMITGFDTASKVFYFVNLNPTKLVWEIAKSSFNSIEKTFHSGLEWLTQNKSLYINLSVYHYPFCAFYLKVLDSRKVQMTRIYESLRRTLSGEITDSKYYEVLKGTPSEITRKGISIYEGYYVDLYNELIRNGSEIIQGEEGVILGMWKLMGSKQGLLYRLEWLEKNNYLNLIPEIPIKIKELCSKISIATELLRKFRYTEDVILIDRMAKNYKEAEGIDSGVLKLSIDLLENAITKNFIS